MVSWAFAASRSDSVLLLPWAIDFNASSLLAKSPFTHAGGSLLVGRVITKELVLTMVRLVGVRLTAQQAAKFVPLAGQAVSAALTFGALKYVCEQHIQQCMAVSRQAQLVAPQGGQPTGPGAARGPGD